MGIWGRAGGDNRISEVANSYPHCWAVLTSKPLCMPCTGEVRKVFHCAGHLHRGLLSSCSDHRFLLSSQLSYLKASSLAYKIACSIKMKYYFFPLHGSTQLHLFSFLTQMTSKKVSWSTLTLLLVSEGLLRSLSVSHMVAEHDFRDKFGKSDSDLFMLSSVLRLLRIFFCLT